jgi:hypothetical protein
VLSGHIPYNKHDRRLSAGIPLVEGVGGLILPEDGQDQNHKRKFAHSTQFSGKEYHHSSKAARREDLQVEEPVSCGDDASFDFHPTLPGMLGTTLVGHEVVQMCQPSEKRLLAPFGMVKAFHRE